MSEPRLSGDLFRANLWQVGSKLVGRLFDIISLIVLSRVLTPADFGLIAIAMSVISISEAVTSLPLVSAIVRIKDPPQGMLDTAFTLSLFRGFALAGLLVGVAFVVTRVYSDARLFALILALSVAPIVRGIMSPRVAVQMREMDFRAISTLETVAKMAAFIVSISLAFATHSYWAIASATICSPLVMSGLSFWSAPYRPRLSLEYWLSFKDFLSWNSVSQIFAALNWQMDKLLLGQLVPQSHLGRFSVASDVCGIVTQAILVPLGGPLLAAYSRRHEDALSLLAATHLDATNAIFSVVAPLFVLLALLAHQIVGIVLGPAWNETGDILQWLGLVSVISLPVWHMGVLAMTLNKMKMVAWRTFGEFVVAMPALFLGGFYFGIAGIIVARAISSLVVLGIGLEAVRELLGYSIGRQLWTMRRTAVSLACLACCVLFLRPLISFESLLDLILGTAAVSLAGAFCYLAALLGLWMLDGKPRGIEQLLWGKICGLVQPLLGGV